MNELATQQPATTALASQADSDLLSFAQIVQRRNLVMQVLEGMMKDGIHYGAIPGTKGGKTLLKPGAEMLCSLFRLAPHIEWTTEALGNDNIDVVCKVTLKHIKTGETWAEGVGSCSTKESKHRYRHSGRKCPACEQEDTIIKGREEFGGGWLCFAKKGGCGAKFQDGDQAIEGQHPQKIENPDPADQWNTARKIAKKRAHTDATLSATGCSDVFTQDMEDIPRPVVAEVTVAQPAAQTKQKPPRQTWDQPAKQQGVQQLDDGTWINDDGVVVPPPNQQAAPPPVRPATFTPPQQVSPEAKSHRGSSPDEYPGNVVIEFGKWKGRKMCEVATGYLDWLQPRLEADLNNPEKAQYVESTQFKLSAVTAELAWRDQNDGAPPPASEAEAYDNPEQEAAMGVDKEGAPF